MVAEAFYEPVEHEKHGPISGIVRSLEEPDGPCDEFEQKEPERKASEITLGRAMALGRAARKLAGHQAEYLLQDLPPNHYVRLRKDPDSDQAKEIIFESFGYSTGPLYFAQRLARTILTRHWEEVEVLSADLYENGSVLLDDWEKRRGGFVSNLWTMLSNNYDLVA